MFDLTGRSVLVTGGGTGIGLGIALAVAHAGADVTIAGRREQVLDQAAELAGTQGIRLSTVRMDIRSTEDVDRAVADCVQRNGRLDGVVNSSGIARIGPSEEVSDEEFLDVMNINVVGAFRLSRAAGRVMLAQGAGSIVHIGSLSSIGGLPGRISYAASKHGVLGLCRTLAAEWGASGVRVNMIAPGYVQTPLTDFAVTKGLLDVPAIERRTPLGRRAQPEEMAGPAVFLLSEAASFVTGECLVADGGWMVNTGAGSTLSGPRPL